LTIRGITNSAISNVVKRSLHTVHSLLRLTWLPSATRRESITLVSCTEQKGQNINDFKLAIMNITKLTKFQS
jgi:hypothetical protein